MRFEQAFDPIRSVQVAWKLLKQAPVMVLIGGLLLGFLDGGGPVGVVLQFTGKFNASGMRTRGPDEWNDLKPLVLILVPALACIWLFSFLASTWLSIGFARAVEIGLHTGKDEIGKVFDGSHGFLSLLLARVLAGLLQAALIVPLIGVFVLLAVLLAGPALPVPLTVLLIVIGAVLALAAVVYVGLGLVLVTPVLIFENASPTDAIARSWKLASGQRWQLLWFYFATGVIGVLGYCACCIGAFVTLPLTQVMRFEAYLALTRGDQFPQWWVGTGRFPFDEPVAAGVAPPPAPGWGSEPPPPPPIVPPPLPPQA